MEDELIYLKKELNESKAQADKFEQEKLKLESKLRYFEHETESRQCAQDREKSAYNAAFAANLVTLEQMRKSAIYAEQAEKEGKQHVCTLQLQREALQETVAKLKGQVSELSILLQSKSASEASTQLLLQKNEEERIRLQSALSQANEQLVSLHDDKAHALNDLRATSLLLSASSQEHQKHCGALQSQLSELEAKHSAITEEVSDCRKELAALRETHTQLLEEHQGRSVELDAVVQSLRNTEKESRAKLLVQQREYDGLQEMFKVLESKSIADEASLQDQYSKCKEANLKLSSAQVQLGHVNAVLDDSRKALTISKAEISENLAEKSMLERSVNDLHTLVEEQNGRLSLAYAEREEYAIQNESLRKENIRLVLHLNKAQKDLSETKSVLVQKNIKMQEMQLKLSNVRANIDSENSSMANVLQETEGQIGEVTTFQSVGVSMESQLGEEREKAESLQYQNRELAGENALYSQSKEIDTLRDELKSAERTSMRLELELSSSKEQVREISRERENLNLQLSDTPKKTRRLVELQDEAAKKVMASESVHDDEKESLRQQLLAANETVNALRERIAAAEHTAPIQSEASRLTDEEAPSTCYPSFQAELKEAYLVNKEQEIKIKKLGKLVQRILAEQAVGTRVDMGIPSEIAVLNEEHKIAIEPVRCDERVCEMQVDVELRYHEKRTNEPSTKLVLAKYTGPLVDSLPHGPGVLKFEGGDLYVGTFEDGQMNGSGSYVRRRKRNRYRMSQDNKTARLRTLQGTCFLLSVLLALSVLQLADGFMTFPMPFFQSRMSWDRCESSQREVRLPRVLFKFWSTRSEEIGNDGAITQISSVIILLEEKYLARGGNKTHVSKNWKRTRNYLYKAANRLTMQQIIEVLKFLDARFPPHISRLVLQECHRILRKPIESYLIPTSDFLLQLWGEKLFIEAIERNPSLLLSRGVGNIPASQRIRTLENVSNSSSSASVELLLTNRAHLTDKAIWQMKKSSPFVFGLATSKVESLMNFMEEILKEGNIDASADVSKALGKLISSHPHLLNLSVDSNLRPRIEFLARKCKMNAGEVKKVVETSGGSILGLSVEQNLRPTIDYIQSEIFSSKVAVNGDSALHGL